MGEDGSLGRARCPAGVADDPRVLAGDGGRRGISRRRQGGEDLVVATEEYYGDEGTGVITLTFTSSGFSGSETGTLDTTESGVAVDTCSLNVLMTGTKM